jgi:acyl-CoA oxidase
MKDTKLQAFIPLFYLVWSDDLLTEKEFVTLQKFINAQDWFSPEEQQLLLSKISVSNPPSRQDIADWKNKIEKTIQDNPAIKSIFEVAVALSEKDASVQKIVTSFAQL